MIPPEHSRLFFQKTPSARGGFSYLEILITIVILSVFFLPAMQMFSASVEHLAYVSDMNTALSLGREGMERFRNLRVSEEKLKSRGDLFIPPLEEDPIELNGAEWRILQSVRTETDPLEVGVAVYKNESFEEPLVELKTLIEEID